MTMLHLKRSSNPYLKGLRPRKFFQGVSKQLRRNELIGDKRKFNPNWANKAA